jgi:hypothetical protein
MTKPKKGESTPTDTVGGAPPKPKKSQASKTRTGREPGPRKRGRDVGRTAIELTRQRTAIQLRMRGATLADIADALTRQAQEAGHTGPPVDHVTAGRLIARGLEEYYEDRDKVVARYVAENLARYDLVLRTYFHRGVGSQNADPDAKAMKIALEAMRDAQKVLGIADVHRIDLTGRVDVGRELDAFLDRIKSAVSTDVFEQILAVAAGEAGAATPH